MIRQPSKRFLFCKNQAGLFEAVRLTNRRGDVIMQSGDSLYAR
jgi:hypothetical protein